MRDTFKRVLFGNLILKPSNRIVSDKYVMINLHSFRRRILSEGQFSLLFSFYNCTKGEQNASGEARELYNQLVAEKQILSDEIKEYYDSERKRIIDEKLSAVTPLINRITISPTYSCNFNCGYCYQRDFTDKQRVMTKQDVDQIIDYICYINQDGDYKSSIGSVSINGGETCLPQNIKTIEYILQKFANDSERKFELFTNGANILNVKNQIDFGKFNRVQVSLDGNEEIFEAVNGVSGSLFKRVVAGIVYLAEKVPEVDLSCVITRQLIADFDDVYSSFESYGLFELPNVSFRLSPASCFKTTTIDRSFISLRELSAFDKKLKEKENTQNIRLGSIYEMRHIMRILRSKSVRDVIINETACSVLEKRSIMFSPDGNVYWCICGQQDKGVIGKYTNPRPKDITSIKKYIHRSVHDMEGCSNCDFKYICTGGCPIYAVVKHNDPTRGECGLFEDSEFMEHMEKYVW